MTNSPSEEEIRSALSEINHPEINCSLVTLGMINNIVVKGKDVSVTLKLPVMEIPAQVKDYLVNSIRQALSNLDDSLEAEISLATMSQEDRMNFISMAKANWTG